MHLFHTDRIILNESPRHRACPVMPFQRRGAIFRTVLNLHGHEGRKGGRKENEAGLEDTLAVTRIS